MSINLLTSVPCNNKLGWKCPTFGKHFSLFCSKINDDNNICNWSLIFLLFLFKNLKNKSIFESFFCPLSGGSGIGLFNLPPSIVKCYTGNLYAPGCAFATLHFLRNLWKGQKSWTVCPWQAFPAYFNVTH